MEPIDAIEIGIQIPQRTVSRACGERRRSLWREMTESDTHVESLAVEREADGAPYAMSCHIRST
jgi:hypothetical protein